MLRQSFKKLSRNKFRLRAGLAGLLAAILLLAFVQDAFALRVSMKRIIFEGKNRSQVITIINNTTEEQTYRLGWRDFKMTEDKMLEGVTEEERATMKLAEPFLRYAPRRITVPAGESQQVRIMARLPADMEDGEYRSHLYISPEAKPPAFTPEEEQTAKTKPVIKINMLTGLSLPVFIRKGDLKATAAISDVKVAKTGEAMKVSLVLSRQGNRSLYGDFDFTCTGAGSDRVVRQLMGIAVYPEVSRRNLEFDVPYPEDGAAGCPQMKITYTAEPDDPQFSGGVMAETVVSTN